MIDRCRMIGDENLSWENPRLAGNGFYGRVCQIMAGSSGTVYIGLFILAALLVKSCLRIHLGNQAEHSSSRMCDPGDVI